MRLFDEKKEIKHSSALMQLKRTLCLVVSLGAVLMANAQPTFTPYPPAQIAPSAPTTSSTQITNSSSGQTRETRVLGLQDCIKLALEHNLDIQIQKYNPIINQYAINFDLGAYEPTFSMTAQKTYDDRPSLPGIDPKSGLPFTSSIGEANTYNPAISGVLPMGLKYDLSSTISRNSELTFGPPPHYLPPTFQSSAGITLSQPLLKNFWIDNTRLQIELSKGTLKISEAALRLQIMTSVTAVESAYYNLLYARGNVEANATAYKLAQQLVTENVKRVEVGALAPLDEKQSESQAASSLAAMHAAEQQLTLQENTLKSLLTDHFAEWADVTLLPAEALVAIPQTPNKQESWRRAIAQRPDLAEAKFRVEQQNVTLKYDFNQIFPELDVIGSYGQNASDLTFNNNMTDLRKGTHSFYSYGATVSVPLGGNYSARAQYKSAKASLKQLLLELKQTEQNIIIAVDNDVGQLNSSLQQVNATRDARIYAEEALAAERKKLENGKSTSFVVLQLISNLTTARVNEIQALANYNIAISQLALDEGNTLEANRIQLKVK